MADRNVVASNTFEQFRVEFNELATDVGNISTGGNVVATGNLQTGGNLTNGSINLTFPTVGGTVSTEGFSIALATALG